MNYLYENWIENHDYSKPTHKTLTATFLLTQEDIDKVKRNNGNVFCQNEYWEIDTNLDLLIVGLNRVVLTKTIKF